MERRKQLFFLTLILLLGAVLRILNISVQDLWIDETFTYYAVKQPDLLAVLQRDVHPPLYFLLMRGWTELTGVSELALRYFSVLPGMVSIALVYHLAREAARIRPRPVESVVPLLASLLMALAEMESYIAQESRSYTLHVMLAVLSMLAYLRWARTSQGKWAVVWVISLTLLVHTHYLGAWTGVVQGLHALFFLRGHIRFQALGALLIPAAVFSIWLLTVVLPYQVNKADSDATIDPSTLETLFLYGRSWLTYQWALMLGLLLLGTVKFTEDRRIRWRPVSGTVLLVLWILVPVMLTFLGNTRFSIMTNYRLSQITPAFVLLWAFGLGQFRPPVRGFLVGVIVLYSVLTVDFYREKEPWDRYTRLASEFALPGDAVLMDFKGVDFSVEYYLDHQLPPDVDVYSLRRIVEWEPNYFAWEFPAVLASESTVWLPRWNDTALSFDLLHQAGFTETAHRIMDYWGNTLEVYRFDRLSHDESVTRFDNGMVLQKVYFDGLRVDLWWSIDEATTRDFTTSAFLLNENGQLAAQLDSYPMLNERPTSTWEVGDVVYDPKLLKTVDGNPLQPGTYQVGVVVYRLNQRGAARRALTADGQDMVIIGEIEVE